MSKKHISISPGSTWTTKHCSHGRTIDAGGSVRDAVSSPAFLYEICEKSRIERSKHFFIQRVVRKIDKKLPE